MLTDLTTKVTPDYKTTLTADAGAVTAVVEIAVKDVSLAGIEASYSLHYLNASKQVHVVRAIEVSVPVVKDMNSMNKSVCSSVSSG